MNDPLQESIFNNFESGGLDSGFMTDPLFGITPNGAARNNGFNAQMNSGPPPMNQGPGPQQQFIHSSPPQQQMMQQIPPQQKPSQQSTRRRSVKVEEQDDMKDEDYSSEEDHRNKKSGTLRRTGAVRRKKGGWTEIEDKMLHEAIRIHGPQNWKEIARHVPGKNHTQCSHRWQKVLHPGLIKGPWSVEEDNIILEQVRVHGTSNWTTVAAALPGRNGKQCRERYINHLDPNVKKGPWSEEELHTLVDMQSRIGNKWSQIAKHIPGRTDNACKNQFHAYKIRQKKGLKPRKPRQMKRISIKMVKDEPQPPPPQIPIQQPSPMPSHDPTPFDLQLQQRDQQNEMIQHFNMLHHQQQQQQQQRFNQQQQQQQQQQRFNSNLLPPQHPNFYREAEDNQASRFLKQNRNHNRSKSDTFHLFNPQGFVPPEQTPFSENDDLFMQPDFSDNLEQRMEDFSTIPPAVDSMAALDQSFKNQSQLLEHMYEVQKAKLMRNYQFKRLQFQQMPPQGQIPQQQQQQQMPPQGQMPPQQQSRSPQEMFPTEADLLSPTDMMVGDPLDFLTPPSTRNSHHSRSISFDVNMLVGRRDPNITTPRRGW